MMQLKTYEIADSVFDETAFLGEHQIKSIFGTISGMLKRSLSDPKKSTPVTTKEIVWIDCEDDGNEKEKQRFEGNLADFEIEDQEAAL